MAYGAQNMDASPFPFLARIHVASTMWIKMYPWMNQIGFTGVRKQTAYRAGICARMTAGSLLIIRSYNSTEFAERVMQRPANLLIINGCIGIDTRCVSNCSRVPQLAELRVGWVLCDRLT